MKKIPGYCTIIASMAFATVTQATTVILTATDDYGETSYNTGLHWSDAAAPHAGNDYVVPLQWLRTPTSNGGTYEFAGDSLIVTNAGGLIVKSDNSTHVISNLVLINGGRIWGGNSTGNTGTVFRGHITVQNTGVAANQYIFANQSGYIFQSGISGAGDLTLAGSNPLWFSGTNDMTGNIIIQDAGARTFTSTSKNIFTIGANGVNNKIYGSGPAVFNGTFAFNLAGASTNAGSGWTIVDVTSQSFGSTFSVGNSTGATVVDNGDGSWSLDDAAGSGGKFLFNESDGTLSAVDVLPEVSPPVAELDEDF